MKYYSSIMGRYCGRNIISCYIQLSWVNLCLICVLMNTSVIRWADMTSRSEGGAGEPHLHCISTFSTWFGLHIKLFSELEHQLQALLHRQTVRAVGILSIGTRAARRGHLTSPRPWEILGAVYCQRERGREREREWEREREMDGWTRGGKTETVR